jgi:hypothetical protein
MTRFWNNAKFFASSKELIAPHPKAIRSIIPVHSVYSQLPPYMYDYRGL